MVSRQLAVSDFFAQAAEMREVLDTQFKNTYRTAMKWHYFCDPDQYTYLRVNAQEAFPPTLFESFMGRLRAWCVNTLGLVPMGPPNLHLMVNGCRLGLHSDFHNGVWGYVYSLTRWDERRFRGGETILLRDGIPSYKKHHVHGGDLYELFPPAFNQLLVFDDRLVHATRAIEGSMDPLDGRIALVGHIRAASPLASHAALAEETRHAIFNALERSRDRLASYRDVQGTVVYRIVVGESGAVTSVTPLTDNLITPVSGYGKSDPVLAVRSMLTQGIGGLKFKDCPSGAEILIPILLPLPDLRPLDVSVTHELSRDAIRKSFDAHLPEFEESGLVGSWHKDSFVVREPVSGSIRIEPRQIASTFDPPMWVPSQREQFRKNVREWLEIAAGHPVLLNTRE